MSNEDELDKSNKEIILKCIQQNDMCEFTLPPKYCDVHDIHHNRETNEFIVKLTINNISYIVNYNIEYAQEIKELYINRSNSNNINKFKGINIYISDDKTLLVYYKFICINLMRDILSYIQGPFSKEYSNEELIKNFLHNCKENMKYSDIFISNDNCELVFNCESTNTKQLSIIGANSSNFITILLYRLKEASNYSAFSLLLNKIHEYYHLLIYKNKRNYDFFYEQQNSKNFECMIQLFKFISKKEDYISFFKKHFENLKANYALMYNNQNSLVGKDIKKFLNPKKLEKIKKYEISNVVQLSIYCNKKLKDELLNFYMNSKIICKNNDYKNIKKSLLKNVYSIKNLISFMLLTSQEDENEQNHNIIDEKDVSNFVFIEALKLIENFFNDAFFDKINTKLLLIIKGKFKFSILFPFYKATNEEINILKEDNNYGVFKINVKEIIAFFNIDKNELSNAEKEDINFIFTYFYIVLKDKKMILVRDLQHLNINFPNNKNENHLESNIKNENKNCDDEGKIICY